MPLHSQVLQKYINPTFIETGTYHGEAVDMALKLGFKEIHTMDVNADFIKGVADKHKGKPGVHTYTGHSADLLASIVRTMTGPITFWLDAHPLIVPMTLFEAQFPLMDELLILRRFLKPGKHAILMDDMRTYSPREIEILEFAVRQMWPNAKHGRENGIATDDVLVVDMR